VWDLRYDEANRVPVTSCGNTTRERKARWRLPGNYQVRLTANGKTLTAPLEVKIDPRVTVSQADLESNSNWK